MNKPVEGTCKCGICIQYGCDCVETGDHDECMCSECGADKPTVDNYGS